MADNTLEELRKSQQRVARLLSEFDDDDDYDGQGSHFRWGLTTGNFQNAPLVSNTNKVKPSEFETQVAALDKLVLTSRVGNDSGLTALGKDMQAMVVVDDLLNENSLETGPIAEVIENGEDAIEKIMQAERMESVKRISQLLSALQHFKERETKRVEEIIHGIEKQSGLKKLEAAVFEKEEHIDNLKREIEFKKEFVRLQQQQEGIKYEALRIRLEEIASIIVKSKLESSEKLRLHVEDAAARLERDNSEVVELNHLIARMLHTITDDAEDIDRINPMTMKRDGIRLDSDSEVDSDEESNRFNATRPVEIKKMQRDVDESVMMIQQLMMTNADKLAENRIVESRIKGIREAIDNYQKSDDAKALKRLNVANHTYEDKINETEQRIKVLEQFLVTSHREGIQLLDTATLERVAKLCKLREEARQQNRRKLQDDKLEQMGYPIKLNSKLNRIKPSFYSNRNRESIMNQRIDSTKDNDENSEDVVESTDENHDNSREREYCIPLQYQHRIADSTAKALLRASRPLINDWRYTRGGLDGSDEQDDLLDSEDDEDDGKDGQQGEDADTDTDSDDNDRLIPLDNADDRLHMQRFEYDSIESDDSDLDLDDGALRANSDRNHNISTEKDNDPIIGTAPPLAFAYLDKHIASSNENSIAEKQNIQQQRQKNGIPSLSESFSRKQSKSNTLLSLRSMKKAQAEWDVITGTDPIDILPTVITNSASPLSTVSQTKATVNPNPNPNPNPNALYTTNAANAADVDDFGISEAILMTTELYKVLTGKYDENDSHFDSSCKSIISLEELHNEIEQNILSIKRIFSQLRKNDYKKRQLTMFLDDLVVKRDRLRRQMSATYIPTQSLPIVSTSLEVQIVEEKTEIANELSAEEVELLVQLKKLEGEINAIDASIAEKQRELESDDVNNDQNHDNNNSKSTSSDMLRKRSASIAIKMDPVTKADHLVPQTIKGDNTELSKDVETELELKSSLFLASERVIASGPTKSRPTVKFAESLPVVSEAREIDIPISAAKKYTEFVVGDSKANDSKQHVIIIPQIPQTTEEPSQDSSSSSSSGPNIISAFDQMITGNSESTVAGQTFIEAANTHSNANMGDNSCTSIDGNATRLSSRKLSIAAHGRKASILQVSVAALGLPEANKPHQSRTIYQDILLQQQQQQQQMDALTNFEQSVPRNSPDHSGRNRLSSISSKALNLTRSIEPREPMLGRITLGDDLMMPTQPLAEKPKLQGPRASIVRSQARPSSGLPASDTKMDASAAGTPPLSSVITNGTALSTSTEEATLPATQASRNTKIELSRIKQIRRKRMRRSRLKRKVNKTVSSSNKDNFDGSEGESRSQELDASNAKDTSDDDTSDGDNDDDTISSLESNKEKAKVEESKIKLRDTILNSMFLDDETPPASVRRKTQLLSHAPEPEPEPIVLSEDLLNKALVFSRSTMSENILKKTVTAVMSVNKQLNAASELPQAIDQNNIRPTASSTKQATSSASPSSAVSSFAKRTIPRKSGKENPNKKPIKLDKIEEIGSTASSNEFSTVNKVAANKTAAILSHESSSDCLLPTLLPVIVPPQG